MELYWLTATGGSSSRLYYEDVQTGAWQKEELNFVPTAVAVFPGDFRSIRRFAQRANRNIVHWSELDRGGHFASMEVPDLLIDGIRVFFRRFRNSDSKFSKVMIALEPITPQNALIFKAVRLRARLKILRAPSARLMQRSLSLPMRKEQTRSPVERGPVSWRSIAESRAASQAHFWIRIIQRGHIWSRCGRLYFDPSFIGT